MKPRPIVPHPTDPSLALVELTRGFFATIDIVDAAEVGRFNWMAWTAAHSRTAYAVRSSYESGGRREMKLHRFIGSRMTPPIDGDEIDHRNGNGLDCRRSNLRPSTHSTNMRNTGLRADNKSGFKGVWCDEKRGKWEAYIKVDRRQIHLGRYDSLAEAVAVVSEARTRLHGEFARSN